MLIRKFILRATGVTNAAFVLLTAQPLRAQSASDTARIEKLERAVELLEKQNAELQAEVDSLKKHAEHAPAVVPEGKTKTKVTYDGKTYAEKLVPDRGNTKWKLFPAITELELFGDVRLRYEYRGGRTDDTSVAPPNRDCGRAHGAIATGNANGVPRIDVDGSGSPDPRSIDGQIVQRSNAVSLAASVRSAPAPPAM